MGWDKSDGSSGQALSFLLPGALGFNSGEVRFLTLGLLWDGGFWGTNCTKLIHSLEMQTVTLLHFRCVVIHRFPHWLPMHVVAFISREKRIPFGESEQVSNLPVFGFVVGGGELFLSRVKLRFGLMTYFAAFALCSLPQSSESQKSHENVTEVLELGRPFQDKDTDV
ncbi:hypothetical protein E5288_WYG015341 [Bos mutus]|uniref:Uncharacterized protein n=1 Tax=Bos mutus TaxID=72004 RepID=A0A6B0RER6_9CETA|nr:hypothetical protein [Bos mutus]